MTLYIIQIYGILMTPLFFVIGVTIIMIYEFFFFSISEF